MGTYIHSSDRQSRKREIVPGFSPKIWYTYEDQFGNHCTISAYSKEDAIKRLADQDVQYFKSSIKRVKL